MYTSIFEKFHVMLYFIENNIFNKKHTHKKKNTQKSQTKFT